MTSVILENINVKAAVLDGEMIVWDNINNWMAAFGLNKTTARNDNTNFKLCYKIFDILFVKGINDES